MDAQADLSLRRARISEGMFSNVAAHFTVSNAVPDQIWAFATRICPEALFSLKQLINSPFSTLSLAWSPISTNVISHFLSNSFNTHQGKRPPRLYTNSDGPDQTTRMRSLIRAISVRRYILLEI